MANNVGEWCIAFIYIYAYVHTKWNACNPLRNRVQKRIVNHLHPFCSKLWQPYVHVYARTCVCTCACVCVRWLEHVFVESFNNESLPQICVKYFACICVCNFALVCVYLILPHLRMRWQYAMMPVNVSLPSENWLTKQANPFAPANG